MSDFVFIYWDEVPESTKQLYQDSLQDRLLYGIQHTDEADLIKANNGNTNSDKQEKII